MGIRRLLRSNTARAVLLLGSVGILTTACSGTGVGTFSDPATGNWVTFAVHCTSQNDGTCFGYGHGVINGETFNAIAQDLLPDSSECPTTKCIGGYADVSGTGTLGGVQVNWQAHATDNDPSSIDTFNLWINGVHAATITCDNDCFKLLTSSSG